MALAERIEPHPSFDPQIEDGRRSGVESAARDWLETQARVAGFWRDLVVESDGDLDLVRALDAHCEFLMTACGRD